MSETLGTVARALSVLRVVAERGASVGVKDVADALDLPMSTSHRLLDLLMRAGFVDRDIERRRYSVGAEFFRLASIVTQDSTLVSLAQPRLDQLTRETGETTVFAVYLAAEHATCFVAKSDSPNSLRFRIVLYEQTALQRGAAGLAVLASLSREAQASVLERATSLPAGGESLSSKRFYSRISKVRSAGVAVTMSELLPDAVEIAAPVYSAPNRVVGAIMVAIPTPRYSQSKAKSYSALVQQTAAGMLVQR